MSEQAARAHLIHRWYTRPVLFVENVDRAARFYVTLLGFEKRWHSEDGAGTVCQVSRAECDIILCEDAKRRDRGRLFIELTADGFEQLRRDLVERSVPYTETWWGSNALQIEDPDGNELLFPRSS